MNEKEQERRRKRSEKGDEIEISASLDQLHRVIGGLTPGVGYNVRMNVVTTLGRIYSSPTRSISSIVPLPRRPLANEGKSTMEQIKDFIIQPWFLGVLGAVIIVLLVVLVLCCLCKHSNKKDVDDLPIELQNPQAVRKATR